MKAFIVSSLTIAIATTLGSDFGKAIATNATSTEFEKSELISGTYTQRRFRGGTGRREILS